MWVRGEVIKVSIPGPPRVLERNRHRIVDKRDGTRFVASYLPQKSAAGQSSIRRFAFDAMGNRPPLDCPVELKFVAYMPIAASWSKRKREDALNDRIRPSVGIDIDNILKLLADSFKELIWKDDRQVTDVSGWKRYSDRPRLVIEVRSLIWTS